MSRSAQGAYGVESLESRVMFASITNIVGQVIVPTAKELPGSVSNGPIIAFEVQTYHGQVPPTPIFEHFLADGGGFGGGE